MGAIRTNPCKYLPEVASVHTIGEYIGEILPSSAMPEVSLQFHQLKSPLAISQVGTWYQICGIIPRKLSELILS